MLYLVPTPIGNLGDMTSRAIDTLRTADVILAEDTRTSGRLLKRFEISTKMWAYHAHNEHLKVDGIIKELESGKTIALITDAGTPGISDPGFLLVRACHENRIQVSCLPGANALIPALAMSGLPCDKFYFEGFLPQKKGRQTRWKFLSQMDCTIVFYESPHRLMKAVGELEKHIGTDTKVAVIKEISKLHETIFQGALSEVKLQLENRSSIKGEYVVVFRKSKTESTPESEDHKKIEDFG